MQHSIRGAFILSIAMGAVIFFCRLLPFIFFKNNSGGANCGIKKNTASEKFFKFVEKTAPPVAMTVLSFNEIAQALKPEFASVLTFVNTLPLDIIRISVACLVTAVLHIIKRNPLISIFSGTIIFMILR
jgi:branched-subunit amino acid transport protein AzlD